MAADIEDALPSLEEMTALLFKSAVPTFSKCFAPPGANCTRKAIRAHSIQNASVFDLLAEEGHVIVPTRLMSREDGPVFSFAREGRNQASTFKGLCTKHDAALFRTIDTGTVDLENPEHLFLIAYRTVLYGTHSTSATAVQLQTYFQEILSRGVPQDKNVKQLGRSAAAFLAVACATYNYKCRLDQAYLERSFQDLAYDVRVLAVERPTLACSTLFHLELVGGKPPTILGVGLSIFPLSPTQTVAILSYLRDDAGRARAAHSRVLESDGAHQKYELSRLVLNRCENFVLAPSFVSSWSETRRAAIEGLYTATLSEPDFGLEDADYVLFA